MGLTAHCSVIGFFFCGPCPSGLSSIAILLPFLINLLFTTSTTFPVCPGTEEPAGCSFSHFFFPSSLTHPSFNILTRVWQCFPVVSKLVNDYFPPNPILLTWCQSTAIQPRSSFTHQRWLEAFVSILHQGVCDITALEPHRALLTNLILWRYVSQKKKCDKLL